MFINKYYETSKEIKLNRSYDAVNENRMLNHYFLLNVIKEMEDRGKHDKKNG